MTEQTSDTGVIESVYSHYIILGCSVAGIVWGGINAVFVSKAAEAPANALMHARRLASANHLSLAVGQQSRARGEQHQDGLRGKGRERP